jgi:hypothetical protein
MVTSGRVEREWMVRGVERAVEMREVMRREVEIIVMDEMDGICTTNVGWIVGRRMSERRAVGYPLKTGSFRFLYLSINNKCSKIITRYARHRCACLMVRTTLCCYLLSSGIDPCRAH